MRLQARERGVIESGFELCPEGWHIFKVDEGIDYLKKKNKTTQEEEISTSKQGDKNWKFSLVIDDEDDEANGQKVDIIASENKRGEQTVTDLLGATGQFAAFQKAFPGDVSIFDEKVMGKVKGKLPGQLMRGKVKHNPDRKDPDKIYANLVGFGKMSDSVEQLEKDLFPEKAKKGGGKKEAEKTPVAEDEEF